MKFLIVFNLLLTILSSVNLSCPNGLPVSTMSECTDKTDKDFLCCLLREKDNSPKVCFSLDPKSFTGQESQVYGVNTYKLDCGSAQPYLVPVVPSGTNSTSNSSTNNSNNTQGTSTIASYVQDIGKESLYGLGGSTCGVKSPINVTDCSFQTTPDNSCCFYASNEIKGCYWIGRKFNGRYNEGAFDLYCEGRREKTFIYTILVLFIFNLLF